MPVLKYCPTQGIYILKEESKREEGIKVEYWGVLQRELFHNPLASWPDDLQVGLKRLAVLEVAQVCPLDALASDSWKPLAA